MRFAEQRDDRLSAGPRYVMHPEGFRNHGRPSMARRAISNCRFRAFAKTDRICDSQANNNRASRVPDRAPRTGKEVATRFGGSGEGRRSVVRRKHQRPTRWRSRNSSRIGGADQELTEFVCFSMNSYKIFKNAPDTFSRDPLGSEFRYGPARARRAPSDRKFGTFATTGRARGRDVPYPRLPQDSDRVPQTEWIGPIRFGVQGEIKKPATRRNLAWTNDFARADRMGMIV